MRSCLIDGEAVACGRDGMPEFDRLRYRRQDGAVFLFAFDLIELNGQDLRREPIEIRKRELGKLLRWSAQIGLQLNEHIAETSCSATPASSGWRASSRSGSAPATAQGIHATGSIQKPSGARGEARGRRRLGREAMAVKPDAAETLSGHHARVP